MQVMREVGLDDELVVSAETLAALFRVTPRHARNFAVRAKRGRYSLWKSVSAYVASLRRPDPMTDEEVMAQLIAELESVEAPVAMKTKRTGKRANGIGRAGRA